MIAKIGHSYAVANCGLGSFEPLLTDMILGKYHPIGHLVGGSFEDEPAEEELHTFALQRSTIGTVTFLIAIIRLFANLGAPRYHAVVVGLVPSNSPILRLGNNQQQP
jgi:hypothetical protein